MRVRVQRWGNSLAVRIPRPYAADAGLREGSTAELRVEDGRIVLEPVRIPKYRLEDLLERVSEDNLHPEVEAEGPVGRGIW
jgi:antitoxin MazE